MAYPGHFTILPGCVLRLKDEGRSPKLNGCVERAQRTHQEEFYEIVDFPLEVAALNEQLLRWEQTYNTVRPHQALAYLTPRQFLAQWQHHKKEALCH